MKSWAKLALVLIVAALAGLLWVGYTRQQTADKIGPTCDSARDIAFQMIRDGNTEGGMAYMRLIYTACQDEDANLKPLYVIGGGVILVGVVVWYIGTDGFIRSEDASGTPAA